MSDHIQKRDLIQMLAHVPDDSPVFVACGEDEYSILSVPHAPLPYRVGIECDGSEKVSTLEGEIADLEAEIISLEKRIDAAQDVIFELKGEMENNPKMTHEDILFRLNDVKTELNED